MESDDLTLADAIKIALQVESALECSNLLSSPDASLTALTQQLQHSDLTSSQGLPISTEDSAPVQQMSRRRPPVPIKRNCGNCGSNSHANRSPQCPARGQMCYNCSKLNHFVKVFRSAPTNVAPQQRSSQARSECTGISNVILKQAAFRTCTVQLRDVSVPLILDTGAAVSLLNVDTYRQFFSNVPLQRPSTRLCGYGNSKIEIVGTLELPVRYGTRYLPSFTFHVAQQAANLLGLDLFTGLGFSLRDSSGMAILQVSPTIRQLWPTLFDGLGCLTTFTHRPLVNPAVVPVIQPLRRLPLAFRDGVTAELTAGLEEGIIEPINAALWISNLVVAQKKGGGLRICGSYARLTKLLSRTSTPCQRRRSSPLSSTVQRFF